MMLKSIFSRQIRNAIASSSRIRLDSTIPVIHQSNHYFSQNYATASSSTKKTPKSRSKKGIKTPARKKKDDEDDEITTSEEMSDLYLTSSKSDALGDPFEPVPGQDPLDDPIKAYNDSIFGSSIVTTTYGILAPEKYAERERKSASLVIPDPNQSIPNVPSKDQWPKIFYKVPGINSRHRMFIHNVETAKKVIDSLKLEEQSKASGGEKLTIIEGYPGVGALTRELLKKDCVERVITMEHQLPFFQALENLKIDPTLSEKERGKLINVPLSCFLWDSYDEILHKGFLDNIETIKKNKNTKPDYSEGFFSSETWKKPSSILFLAQMPNTVHSEQLLSQLMRAIANRYWLYRYSRVRMAFICSEQLALRCLANPSERLYGKFSMVTGAEAECKVELGSNKFLPYAKHFWPPSPEMGPQLPTTIHSSSIKDHRIRPTPAKEQLCFMTIEPKVKPMLEGTSELEAFDYLTKYLFVLKTHTIKSALLHLAPGAVNILEMMRSGNHPAMKEMRHVKINSNEKVNELSIEQMVALSKMFDRWPFRPSSLVDEGRIEDISERMFF